MNDNHTILIVDDDPAILMGLKLKIKRHGYQVFTAKDGNEGLDKVKTHNPDLVLSDVMMPFPDGFEMRRRLSQDLQLGSIPFIFLTARADAQDRLRGFKEGADDYILKPFDTDELMARIDAVIRRVEFERARGREQMKEMAQKEMEQLKQEFLQNYHHELSTPLTNILVPLEIAVNRKFNSLEEQTRFLRSALSSANRLESLTNDLILLSQIDHGSLNHIRQPIDYNIHILGPIRKRLERYQSKELEFLPVVELQEEIIVPRREFAHAVLHLVDNAFKFSPDKGRVALLVKDIGNKLVISVQDEGCGVPPDLSEKIFERFFQVSNGDSRKYEGLGVGLTIARAVFESNGGSVKISETLHGCHVVAMFPK
jgi:two-component system, sensor histidine kinase and response regulator